jgi:hypothetical protein
MDLQPTISTSDAPIRTMKNLWRVLGYDRFAREEYFIGAFETEEEARHFAGDYEERLEEYQDEDLRDEIFILSPKE